MRRRSPAVPGPSRGFPSRDTAAWGIREGRGVSKMTVGSRRGSHWRWPSPPRPRGRAPERPRTARGGRVIRPLLCDGVDLGPAGAIERQWARRPFGAQVNGTLLCAAFTDSKSLCQLRNIKMYNAWFDLFIKLPCLGLFREESPREGAAWEGASSEGWETAVPRLCCMGHLSGWGSSRRSEAGAGGQPPATGSLEGGARLLQAQGCSTVGGGRTPRRSRSAVDG